MTDVYKKMFPILEDYMGTVKNVLPIEIDIHSTRHSQERQTRHKGTYIAKENIIATLEKAIPKISKYMFIDKVLVGDQIVVKDMKTNLNVVAKITEDKGKIILIVITVMLKKHFHSKGTRTIFVD